MNTKNIVISEQQGAIAKLTLNRPEARNGLSLAMLEKLYELFVELGAAKGVHVITVAANGPAFCAGHDLKELTAARANDDRGRAFFEETMAKCARLMQAIVTCPKPVIASVHGIATAAGCQLVASCDLAIASKNALFATPGVNIGLFCSTPMVALSRNVPRKKAMEMLLTGNAASAEEALQSGLVNSIAAPDELEERVQALATLIAGKAPATLRIGKEAFYRQNEMSLSEAYVYTADVMVQNMMEPDAKEGIQAFIEKRAPNWGSL
ncbi:enoyl-CoA hydratase [Hoeflea sp. TYP-13]|uniref:enoyl-CoA hydratase n=1 Tax=Hoeflea sp. TYP-13 TaxID=3230023 RepID=UPI0034C6CB1C